MHQKTIQQQSVRSARILGRLSWVLGFCMMAMPFTISMTHSESAIAQDMSAAKAPPANAAASTTSKKGDVQTKEYNFEDDVVEGALLKPDGAAIASRVGAKLSSLIKVRQNFVRELIKSVEDL